MTINTNEVTDTFKACLFTDDEVRAANGKPEYVGAHGVNIKVGFYPERLRSKHSQVKAWLDCLSDEFKQSSGGGYTFLNVCTDKNGNLWTDIHQVCDELITLGVGLNLCSILMREMAPVMPGGVPYVVVNDLSSDWLITDTDHEQQCKQMLE